MKEKFISDIHNRSALHFRPDTQYFSSTDSRTIQACDVRVKLNQGFAFFSVLKIKKKNSRLI